MSKKLYVLISTLVGCVGTAASAIVAFCNPAHEVAIVASIGIAVTAINEILATFKEPDTIESK